MREAGRLPTIEGRVPLAGAWPQGCHFAERCVFSTDACSAGPIALEEQVRCVRSAQLADELKEVIR
ncbi:MULTISPECIES: hypothetical protein [unclassified Glutamicibacter]|uniref:ABC transporter ATP-binding protein n=1 Tax=unclassified Glutamicibacter TaxID=2627139 RepID=UPI00382E6836